MRNCPAFTIRSAVALLAGTLSWIGCSGGTEAAHVGSTVRDSAGIEIVESSAGRWTERDAWRVGAQPQLDIGVTEGAEAYQLFRVSDVRRLPDGRIVVANGGTRELRFFDGVGRHLATVGDDGEGPGEFRGLGWVRAFRGDSLLVYDYQLRRLSVLDGQGGFARSLKLEPLKGERRVTGVDVFADGTILAMSAVEGFQGSYAPGLRRPDVLYHSVSPTGAPLDSLGVFAGAEGYAARGGSGNQWFVQLRDPPFARWGTVTVARDGFCFGSQDAYEIRCYRQDGVLRRIVRRAQPPRPVTDADIDRFVDQRVRRLDDPDARRLQRQLWDQAPRHQTMPAYDAIRLDEAGNLWVEDYEPDGDGPATWTVFDPAGRMLGSLALPADLVVTQIGADFVLGTWRDELDVQHVLLYALEKER